MPKAKTIAAEQYVDVESELRGYDDVYLACRDLRHPWVEVGYFQSNGEVKRKLQCARCPTTRTDVWTPGGGRVDSSYDYPDDYQFSGVGTGGVHGEDVRREVLRRHKVYASEGSLNQALSRMGTH